MCVCVCVCVCVCRAVREQDGVAKKALSKIQKPLEEMQRLAQDSNGDANDHMSTAQLKDSVSAQMKEFYDKDRLYG